MVVQFCQVETVLLAAQGIKAVDFHLVGIVLDINRENGTGLFQVDVRCIAEWR